MHFLRVILLLIQHVNKLVIMYYEMKSSLEKVADDCLYWCSSKTFWEFFKKIKKLFQLYFRGQLLTSSSLVKYEVNFSESAQRELL